MIYIGVEAIQIGLFVETVGVGDGTAVADLGIIFDDFSDAIIVIYTTAGVSHAYYIVAHQNFQIFTILLWSKPVMRPCCKANPQKKILLVLKMFVS